MKKTVLWLIAILVLIGVIYLFISNPKNNKSNSTATSLEPVLTGGVINGNEIMLCVPRRVVDGKCLIGLKETATGNNYALLDSSGKPVDPNNYITGQKIYIYGNIATEASLQKDYNIVGVVELK